MTNQSKSSERLRDWLAFFAKYMHLLTPEQEKSLMSDMVGGKKAPKKFTPQKLTVDDADGLKKHIANVIKKYRELSDMSSTEFANAIGHSRAYVSLIESGKRGMNIVDLQKAMKILKIPQEEIFLPLQD